MFLCPRKDFATWIENRGLPRMSDFYRWRRRMHGILIDENGKPEGGSWSPDNQDQFEPHGGRLYVTCLSIYMLEVYYRHLPIYEKIYTRLLKSGRRPGR